MPKPVSTPGTPAHTLADTCADTLPSACPAAALRSVRRARPMEPVEALHPHLFVPTPQRPVRAKQHRLSARTRVIPCARPIRPMVRTSLRSGSGATASGMEEEEAVMGRILGSSVSSCMR